MRVFALCSNKPSDNKPVQTRTVWDDKRLKEALIILKETKNIKTTAKQLGVKADNLKRALRRRGFVIRAAMSRLVSHDKGSVHKSPQTIFGPNAFISEESPFIAQVAIENKPINGCSWPIGDLKLGDFKFCGAERAKGSYCQACHDKAYKRTEPLSESDILALYKLAYFS